MYIVYKKNKIFLNPKSLYLVPPLQYNVGLGGNNSEGPVRTEEAWVAPHSHSPPISPQPSPLISQGV